VSEKARVAARVSCQAGTVSGGLLLASAAPPDSPQRLPRCSCCSLPEPWPAGMDTAEARRGSCVQAWAGAGACRAVAAGVAQRLQRGGTQICSSQLPALLEGGHGVVGVAWGLGEEQGWGEWVRDVEVGLAW
jgi:hypothetical protein